jgi:hypothetical protein
MRMSRRRGRKGARATVRRVLRPPAKAVRDLSRRRRVRQATSGRRLLPAFLVIGAQPTGAMSLFNALCRHPQVAGPTPAKEDVEWSREPHFFDDNFWRGVDWYRSFFPLSASAAALRRFGRDLVPGETTPSYIVHPAAPGRAAATIPEARLIAVVRDPVDRAYAHYDNMKRQGLENLSFEEAIAAEEERLAGEEELLRSDERHGSGRYRNYGYVTRSLYADQLERWLDAFPREQLLVLRAEDFVADPGAVFAQTVAFLGLHPWRPQGFGAAYRLVSTEEIDPAFRAQLEERFTEPNARLARLVGRDFGWTGSARSGPETVVPG